MRKGRIVLWRYYLKPVEGIYMQQARLALILKTLMSYYPSNLDCMDLKWYTSRRLLLKKKLKICSCEVTYVLQFFKASSKSLLGGYCFRLAPTKSFYLYFLTLSGMHFPAWNADRRYKEQPAWSIKWSPRIRKRPLPSSGARMVCFNVIRHNGSGQSALSLLTDWFAGCTFHTRSWYSGKANITWAAWSSHFILLIVQLHWGWVVPLSHGTCKFYEQFFYLLCVPQGRRMHQ